MGTTQSITAHLNTAEDERNQGSKFNLKAHLRLLLKNPVVARLIPLFPYCKLYVNSFPSFQSFKMYGTPINGSNNVHHTGT